MKKNLYILAVACLALASCSNDETVATRHDPNEISFRANVNGTTRAVTDVTTATLSSFYAEAYNNSDNSSYFSKTLFTKDGETTNYRSATKYYWPPTGNLDFIAFYPDVDTQFGHSTWNTFTLSPADDVSTHQDYVVAATINQTKAGSATGIPMHFKHLGAQIIVKVYNSQGTASGNLKATVTGWKIGYLSKSGTYTFASSTATATAITAPTIALGSQKTENVPNAYSQTVTSTVISGDTRDESGEAVQIGTPIIVVPQTVTTFNAASTYATDGYLPGAFIAVKMLIEDLSGNDLADATADGIWAAWPITNSWVAGTKYTYTIDLSQGGYKEKDTANDTVKPWLENNEIFFSSVDVTPWVEAAGTSPFPNPAPAP